MFLWRWFFWMRLTFKSVGSSLVVQWLGLCASTTGGMGSIPGGGTKIPHAAWCGQKKKIGWLLIKQIILHNVGGPHPISWRTNFPELEGILPADGLHTWTSTLAFPCISSLTAHPADFRLGSLHNHMSQFLKIKLSLVYTHPICSVFLEKPDECSCI